VTEPGLLTLSLSAFTAVLVLLGALALVIRLLTSLFPGAPPIADAAVVAAIQAAVHQSLPGHRVTRIEALPERGRR
jgi:hypothetical protein